MKSVHIKPVAVGVTALALVVCGCMYWGLRNRSGAALPRQPRRRAEGLGLPDRPTQTPSLWENSKFPIVLCNTTQGGFAIEVHPEWAPIGAERYLQLVEAGFFTRNLFYRVPQRSHPIAQFGVSPNLQLRRAFGKVIPDDPPVFSKVPIRRGMLAFAGSPGPPSRSCHMWFAIEGKSYMGHDSWEPPVGIILGDGAKVLDRIQPTRGVDVWRATSDPTFETDFPGEYLKGKPPIEWFEQCSIAWDPWVGRKRYVPQPKVCPNRRACVYSDPMKKRFLAGCVDDCAGYSTLAEAKAKCDGIERCGGVIQNGPDHFEIREGTDGPLPSSGETAFLKIGPLVPA
eukprot:m.192684 g.192684  ORF g.192684 m.192684 type:complete len:341 (-) comp15170_c0_seq3:92-1114(-)